MSHLTNIGFTVSSAEEFESLVTKVFEEGQLIDVEGGSYMVYSDKSGAQIYAQVDEEDEFMGFIPAFDAHVLRNIEVTNLITYEDATSLDMRVMVKTVNGEAPFVLDVPNGKEKALLPNMTQEVALVAFPHEIEYFETENLFLEEYPELSKHYFIPVGMMNQEGEALETPEAYAMFIGQVKSVELRVNETLGGEFYVMVLSTLDGEITVVASTGFLAKAPEVNGFINGVFWMTAKV
jgi:hypothetical protein